jgi:hypothetical protein
MREERGREGKGENKGVMREERWRRDERGEKKEGIKKGKREERAREKAQVHS